MQGELRRTGLDGLQDQVAVEADAFAALAHVGTGILEDLTCARVHEVHAHLFENRQRGVVDRFQLVFRDDRDRGETVLQAAVFGR